MNILSYIMVCFSVLGAIDCILNNRFGIGKEWERGFYLLGTMSLSMIGMIILAPCIAQLLSPILSKIPSWIPFEPSIIAGSLLANDMGGAPLAMSLASNEKIGYFNGLVVSTMMGVTISFTLPLAMGVVEKRQQRSMLLGILCGIVAIPVGCVVSGFIAGIPIKELVIDLIPLVLLAIVLAIGLMKAPDFCIKIFKGLGIGIKILIIIGMLIGIITFLTGYKILPEAAPIEEGAMIVFNAAIVMSGAFPLLHIVGIFLRRPLKVLGKAIGINDASALGFVASLATSVTTFSMMKDMDEKGVVLNSAFAVSAAFTFAGHLAFTMSFNRDFVPCVICGKLVSGIIAVLLAWVMVRNKRMGE